ncbi:hypothetical protein ACHAXA_001393 [Cyclostephanos tholiformis]|uniref:Uncharacterized protein n=1 Tax=Cyclostephanos tholiformis TaxID=382380 RepID=A0ABD3R0T9_9STRA
MPPKKPPSQAGKFKPLMRPAKRPDAPPPPATAATAAAAAATTATVAPPSRGGRGRGRGLAAGGGGGGRGGRGGGRFVVPAGQAFFTGEAAKRGGGEASASSSSSSRAAGARGGSGGGGGGGVASRGSAAESIAAAMRARAGEGEEFIVAEILDLNGDDFGDGGVGNARKGGGREPNDGPSRSKNRNDGMPGPFDDEDNRNEDYGDRRDGVLDAFMYDSDSSAEERIAKRGGKNEGGGGRGDGMLPTQLPFPSSSHRRTMYDCQEEFYPEPHATSSSLGLAATASPSKMSDPPLQSPFFDLTSASDESDNKAEAKNDSWFLMKFPTRLPLMDASSSSLNASNRRAARIKSEFLDEGDNLADFVESGSHADTSAALEAGSLGSATASSGPLGYDDTLKDALAGRYGKIVIRRSGKTELIIGGGGDGHEVRLLIHEGLQCGFRQEAVCIDPDNATFVSLGCVDKSIVVTPDIERAFVVS